MKKKTETLPINLVPYSLNLFFVNVYFKHASKQKVLLKLKQHS